MLKCYVHMCTVAGSSIDDAGVIVNIVPLDIIHYYTGCPPRQL